MITVKKNMSQLLILSALLMSAPLNAANGVDRSYGDRVGDKALNGLANLATGWLEIPKSMINTTNEVNLAFGLTGGMIKGVVNTVGRMTTGAVDLITAPVLTRQVASPEYVWDDFDANTRYGDVFRLDEK